MGRGLKYLFLFLLLVPALGLANGLELRITLSGKLLLGLGYRYQFDDNTAVRFGAFMGVSGAPVGFHAGLVQDITPTRQWTPFFELGADMLLYKKQQRFSQRIMPSAQLGFSYRTRSGLRHNAEVWLAYAAGQLRPMGLSYVHVNPVY